MNRQTYTFQDILHVLDNKCKIVEDSVPDHITTKKYITIECSCGTCRSVRIREFFRSDMPPVTQCKKCAIQSRSEALCIANASKKQDVIQSYDLTTHKICSGCKKIFDKSHFVNFQYPDKETKLCTKCRKDGEIRRDMTKQRRYNIPVNDNEKRCISSCKRVLPLTEFDGNNKHCRQCRQADKNTDANRRERAKIFNASNEDHKICPECGKKHPIETFYSYFTENYQTLCHQCRQNAMSNRDKLANAYLEVKKESGPCVDCGENDIRLLTFDHINRDNKIDEVSQMSSLTKMLEEIKKCEVRCYKCHLKRTKQQRAYGQNPRPGKIYVDNIKRESGGCVECGWYDDELLEGLEFDHIDKNTKTSSIATLVANWASIEDIKKEMEKCQILCVDCHKLKTIEDNGCYLYFQETFGKTRAELRQHKIDNGGKLTLDSLIDDAVF